MKGRGLWIENGSCAQESSYQDRSVQGCLGAKMFERATNERLVNAGID